MHAPACSADRTLHFRKLTESINVNLINVNRFSHKKELNSTRYLENTPKEYVRLTQPFEMTNASWRFSTA